MTYHVTITETVESVISIHGANSEEEARIWVKIGNYNEEDQTEPESFGDLEILDVTESEEVT